LPGLPAGSLPFMNDSARAGIGFDSHPFSDERRLVLGGVPIPGVPGLSGHSDADVLTHAVIDALLGAAGLGDIGDHFPDTDRRTRGISSLKLLAHTVKLLKSKGFKTVHVDGTVLADRPRLGPYKARIRRCLARILGVPLAAVNLKGKSTQGLGSFGVQAGMAAWAVVTVSRQQTVVKV
jgi:2-C-methyl-D-erythritol 2,4-cyclodiphosphate synthase